MKIKILHILQGRSHRVPGPAIRLKIVDSPWPPSLIESANKRLISFRHPLSSKIGTSISKLSHNSNLHEGHLLASLICCLYPELRFETDLYDLSCDNNGSKQITFSYDVKELGLEVAQSAAALLDLVTEKKRRKSRL